jgi:hypothetical protein
METCHPLGMIRLERVDLNLIERPYERQQTEMFAPLHASADDRRHPTLGT